MVINADFLVRCVNTLEAAFDLLRTIGPSDSVYEIYRDARNDTAHRYGEGFAETTLKLLPQFIADARELARVINEEEDD